MSVLVVAGAMVGLLAALVFFWALARMAALADREPARFSQEDEVRLSLYSELEARSRTTVAGIRPSARASSRVARPRLEPGARS